MGPKVIERWLRMQNPSDGVTPDIRLELLWTNWMVQRRKERRNDSARAPKDSGGVFTDVNAQVSRGVLHDILLVDDGRLHCKGCCKVACVDRNSAENLYYLIYRLLRYMRNSMNGQGSIGICSKPFTTSRLHLLARIHSLTSKEFPIRSCQVRFSQLYIC